MTRWTVYLQTERTVRSLGVIEAVDAEIALIVARRCFSAGVGSIGVIREGMPLPSAETRDMLEHPKGAAGYFALARAMNRAGFNSRNRKR